MWEHFGHGITFYHYMIADILMILMIISRQFLHSHLM